MFSNIKVRFIKDCNKHRDPQTSQVHKTKVISKIWQHFILFEIIKKK